MAEVSSSHGGRDVVGEGGAPTGEFNANGTTNCLALEKEGGG